MNENLNNSKDNNSTTGNDIDNKMGNHVRKFFMNKQGIIKSGNTGTEAVSGSTRTFIIIGWICAALTAFISPLFAIAGIVFGVLADRKAKGSGNALIITNIVLAMINLIFGLFFVAIMRRTLFGY